MLALVVPFLIEHLRVPAWLAKALLALLAACLLLIAIAVGSWQLRVYAEHETRIVAATAAEEAKARMAAAINAASESAVRDQHEAQAREMARLAASDASNAAMWAALEQTLSSIPETPDASPSSVPEPVPVDVLDPLPPVGPFLPASGRRTATLPARSVPSTLRALPAAPRLRPSVPGFADLVGADRAADRLLERASAGAP